MPRRLLPLLNVLLLFLLLPGAWSAGAEFADPAAGTWSGPAHDCTRTAPVADGPRLTALAGALAHHDPGSCPDADGDGRCCDGCPVVPLAFVALATAAVPDTAAMPYRLPEEPGHTPDPPRRPPR